jgi:hypothetical protein
MASATDPYNETRIPTPSRSLSAQCIAIKQAQGFRQSAATAELGGDNFNLYSFHRHYGPAHRPSIVYFNT